MDATVPADADVDASDAAMPLDGTQPELDATVSSDAETNDGSLELPDADLDAAFDASVIEDAMILDDAMTPEDAAVDASAPSVDPSCPELGPAPACTTPAAFSRFFGRDTYAPPGVDVADDAFGHMFSLYRMNRDRSANFGGGTIFQTGIAVGSALAKHDRCGNHVWSKAYKATLVSLAPDSEGNVVVVGMLLEPDIALGLQNQARDVVVAKFGPCGALLWAHALGGAGDQDAYHVAIDEHDAIYVAGDFFRTASWFGQTLSSTSMAGFVLKLTPSGEHIWTRVLHTSSADTHVRAVATVAGAGAFVIGKFQDTLDLGEDSITSNLVDAFVARYDAGGDLEWVTALGGGGDQEGIAIASGASFVVVAGSFDQEATLGGVVHDAGGTPSTFVARLGLDGALAWSRSYGAETLGANALAVGPDGDTLIAGPYQDSVDVGGGPITSPPPSLVLARYSAAGEHVFSTSYRNSFPWLALDFADDDSSTLITGLAGGAIDFGHGSSSGHRAFLVSLPADDELPGATMFPGDRANVLDPPDPDVDLETSCATDTMPAPFIATYGGVGQDHANALVADAWGAVYVAGQYGQGLELEGGETLEGYQDVFLSRHAPDGTRDWTVSFGDTAYDAATDVALDPDGHAVIVGSFRGTIAPSGQFLESRGLNDIFVSKISCRGEVAWTRRFGSIGYDNADAVAVDSLGYVYVAGTWSRRIELGEEYRDLGDKTAIVLFKLDPQGKLVDHAIYGGSTSTDINSLDIDSEDNLLMAATYTLDSPVLDLGGGAIEAGFVASLDSSFGYRWHITRPLAPSFASPHAAPIDGGATFIVRIAAQANFGFGNVAPPNLAHGVVDDDGVLLSASGLPAGSSISSGATLIPVGMRVDPEGNTLIAGTLSGTATFDGTTHVADQYGEMLLLALDESGAPYWSAFYPGHESNELHDVALDDYDRLLASGDFYTGVDFGRGPEVSTGTADIVVLAMPRPTP